MATLTVKLPPPLDAQLDALVRRRGRRKSVLVREAIEKLVAEPGTPEGGSVLALLQDLNGVGRGPKDLSSSPKHMQGYGK